MNSINLREKLALFDEHWSPKIIAEVDGYDVKLAKIEGEFVWHSHADADELFLVLEGEFTMAFRDHEEAVREGEIVVVPAGVEHKPIAENECSILLLEKKGLVNTGDAGGELTSEAIRI